MSVKDVLLWRSVRESCCARVRYGFSFFVLHGFIIGIGFFSRVALGGVVGVVAGETGVREEAAEYQRVVLIDGFVRESIPVCVIFFALVGGIVVCVGGPS